MRIGRLMKFTAREGQGDLLAGLMLRVARSLGSFEGCELYAVNRVPGVPDVIWITEMWASAEAAEAALAAAASPGPDDVAIADVMALLVGPPERHDLLPVGGVGVPD
jgi:quinol monooxygenase YgiN